MDRSFVGFLSASSVATGSWFNYTLRGKVIYLLNLSRWYYWRIRWPRVARNLYEWPLHPFRLMRAALRVLYARGFNLRPNPHPLPGNWLLHHGSQWFCLSGEAVGDVLDYLARDPSFEAVFSDSLIPDMTFFHTLIMNSPLAAQVTGADPHAAPRSERPRCDGRESNFLAVKSDSGTKGALRCLTSLSRAKALTVFCILKKKQPNHKHDMSRYITLLSFTEKGSSQIKESTSRAHAFDALAAKSGVTVEGQYWTIGSHDGVLVLKAESEDRILHLLAELASLGFVRTESLRAFTDKEFDAVLKA